MATVPSAIFAEFTALLARSAVATVPSWIMALVMPLFATARVTSPEVPPPLRPAPAVTPVIVPEPELFSASSESLNSISNVEGSCEPCATCEPKAITLPVPPVTATVSRALAVSTPGNSSLNCFCSCSKRRAV